ncbi:hypothetical protein HK098_007144 [Nowakowskiella sp. JEL0407]|nr:hypothetical protein HK098_007144 [Nowakowskiella sp. JEL0407]
MNGTYGNQTGLMGPPGSLGEHKVGEDICPVPGFPMPPYNSNPQTIGYIEARLMIYMFNGLTIITALAGLIYAVSNFFRSPKRQRLFNLSIIFTGLMFFPPPIVDIMATSALFDGNELHTLQYLTQSNFGPCNGDGSEFLWKINVVRLKALQLSLIVVSVNVHLVTFYFNYTNIRVIHPVHKVWDYIFPAIMAIITTGLLLSFTVFLRALQDAGNYIAAGVLLFDTLLFHFFAIHFLVVIRRHLERKSGDAQQSGTGRMNSRISTTSSQFRTRAGMYRTLAFSGTILWISNILFLTGFLLPKFYNSEFNTAEFLHKIANLTQCVLLLFTVSFVKTVRRLMKSFEPVAGVKTSISFEIDTQKEAETYHLTHLKQQQNNPQVGSRTDLSEATTVHPTSPDRIPPMPQNFQQHMQLQNDMIKRVNSPSPKRYSSDPFSRMPLNIAEQQRNSGGSGGGSSQQSSIPMQNVILTVVRPFVNPKRTDELVLHIGDRVKVDIEFQDGWALGISEATGMRGYFPTSCCTKTPTYDRKGRIDMMALRNGGDSDFSPPRTLSLHSEISFPSLKGPLSPLNPSYSSNSNSSSGQKKSMYGTGDTPPPNLKNLTSSIMPPPLSPPPNQIPFGTPPLKQIASPQYNEKKSPPAFSSPPSSQQAFFPQMGAKSSSISSPDQSYSPYPNEKKNATFHGKVADPTTPPKSELIVITPYTPLRGDELRLVVGERVLLENAFDDAWGFGYDGKKAGFFPLTFCVPESFKSIKTSFTSFIPTYDPNIALLISLPTPAPVAPATIDTFINWSIENGFEFVDLNDSEEPEADTEFNEKFGVDRILEALESNIWDGCARNDRASGTVNGIKHDEIISDSGGDEEVIGDDVQALLVDFESAIGKLQALREMGRTLSDEDRRNLAERIALSFEMLDEEEGPEFNELEGKDVSEEDMDEAFGGWISASEFHSFDDNWKEKSFEENERDGTDECFEYQQLSD